MPGCLHGSISTRGSARRLLSQNDSGRSEIYSRLIFLLDLAFALVFIEIQLHNEAGRGFDRLVERCGERGWVAGFLPVSDARTTRKFRLTRKDPGRKQ